MTPNEEKLLWYNRGFNDAMRALIDKMGHLDKENENHWNVYEEHMRMESYFSVHAPMEFQAYLNGKGMK